MDDLTEQIRERYLAEQILARFEGRGEEIVDEIVACAVAEVGGFQGVDCAAVRSEIRSLADCHLDTFSSPREPAHRPQRRWPRLVSAQRGERGSCCPCPRSSTVT